MVNSLLPGESDVITLRKVISGTSHAEELSEENLHSASEKGSMPTCHFYNVL